MSSRTLLVECMDRRGLVHAITGVLFRHGANVVVNHEFVDQESARFFMRTEFEGNLDVEGLLSELRASLPEGAIARVASSEPRRLVVMASKEHHCLADILVRHAYGELNARLVAVISNHDRLRPLAERFGIPFHHVSHEGRSREDHEAGVQSLLGALRPDLIVLAKYMRVLSAAFVASYAQRLLNIHHSFLPAFAGGRPYHQAFQRGVKVIGATAHFVTEELDAGPIIVQQVIPVDHTHDVQDLARAGRDVEQMVLARALRLVLEDRVFLCRNRTIIFE